MDTSMSHNNSIQFQLSSFIGLVLKSDRKLILAAMVFLSLILGGCGSNAKKPSTSDANNLGKTSQFSEQQQIEYKQALALLSNNKHNEAEVILIKLSKQLPGHAGSWANLGLLNLVQKKPTEAEEFIKTALKINPNMSQALNLMGLVATHNRDIKAAESYYINAIKQDNGYANAHYNLALLYDIYLQDIRKAAKEYREYLKYIEHEDKVTLSWVEQLERALKR